VIETHPPSLVDLRLTAPFAELEAYADSADLRTTDTMEFAHIPFVVLLLRKLKEWRESHAGAPPTSADRRAFLDSLDSLRQQAGDADQENIDEAVAALTQHIWGPLGRPLVPSGVKALLEDPKCLNAGRTSSNFWILVRALKSFVEASVSTGGSYVAARGGALPLPGSLPDMKASSAGYVSLQNVYRRKALQDLADFRTHLESVLTGVGLEPNVIPVEEIESFVKHAGYITLIRGRTERESREQPAKEVYAQAFEDPINPISMPHHIAFLAADRFYTLQSRWPGSDSIFSGIISSSGVLLADDPANGPGFVSGGRSAPFQQASKGPASSASVVEAARGSSSPSHPTAGPAAGDMESMLNEDDRRTFKRARALDPSESSSHAAASLSPDDVTMRDADPLTSAPTASTSNGGAHLQQGNSMPSFEEDVEALVKEARAICTEVGLLSGTDGAWEEEHWDKLEDACAEMVRSGHADLPSTAALLGGLAAQESIKILTRQYIPLDNTCVYDGIKGALGAYRV